MTEWIMNREYAQPRHRHGIHQFPSVYGNMSTYLESEAVTAAKKKTQDHQAQRPEYTSRWEDELEKTLSQLSGRQFSYNLEADPLWSSYRRSYTRKGRLAMEDTLGRTTALTGGYGNSYAANAAQQSYNGYMTALTDKIPELYALAQERYDRQTQDLTARYELYLQNEKQDQQLFADRFDGWLQELKLLQAQEQAALQAEQDRNLAQQEADRWQAEQDRKDQQFQAEQDWLNKKWEAEHPTQASGSGGTSGATGSGDSGSEYDNGGVSTENIKKMQEALGVTPDGIWGPESAEAAGGVTADVAWANYCATYLQ